MARITFSISDHPEIGEWDGVHPPTSEIWAPWHAVRWLFWTYTTKSVDLQFFVFERKGPLKAVGPSVWNSPPFQKQLSNHGCVFCITELRGKVYQKHVHPCSGLWECHVWSWASHHYCGHSALSPTRSDLGWVGINYCSTWESSVAVQKTVGECSVCKMGCFA